MEMDVKWWRENFEHHLPWGKFILLITQKWRLRSFFELLSFQKMNLQKAKSKKWICFVFIHFTVYLFFFIIVHYLVLMNHFFLSYFQLLLSYACQVKCHSLDATLHHSSSFVLLKTQIFNMMQFTYLHFLFENFICCYSFVKRNIHIKLKHRTRKELFRIHLLTKFIRARTKAWISINS